MPVEIDYGKHGPVTTYDEDGNPIELYENGLTFCAGSCQPSEFVHAVAFSRFLTIEPNGAAIWNSTLTQEDWDL